MDLGDLFNTIPSRKAISRFDRADIRSFHIENNPGSHPSTQTGIHHRIAKASSKNTEHQGSISIDPSPETASTWIVNSAEHSSSPYSVMEKMTLGNLSSSENGLSSDSQSCVDHAIWKVEQMKRHRSPVRSSPEARIQSRTQTRTQREARSRNLEEIKSSHAMGMQDLGRNMKKTILQGQAALRSVSTRIKDASMFSPVLVKSNAFHKVTQIMGEERESEVTYSPTQSPDVKIENRESYHQTPTHKRMNGGTLEYKDTFSPAGNGWPLGVFGSPDSRMWEMANNTKATVEKVNALAAQMGLR